MMGKRFWLLNIDDESSSKVEMEILSSTPREAALKAATRDISRICLVETLSGKMHIFLGQKIPLMETEINAFTRKHNITAKPVVRKIGYNNLKTGITASDLPNLVAEFRRLIA